MEFYQWTKKKDPKQVHKPCVLKVGQKVEINRWINQARMYIEEFEVGRCAEVVMILVDEKKETG